MKLSKQQLAYFETFGFLCFPGLLAAQIDEITRRFENVWATYGGGHAGSEHDGEQRSALLPFIDRDKYLSAMLDAPRIDGIVSSILGDEYNYEASDGNFYVGNTEWHSDGYGKSKYRYIKIALYLDPVGRDTGCLRVIPGSHTPPYHHTLEPLSASDSPGFGVASADVPCAYLESEPGDVVMFHQTMWHASFGGGVGRRMLALSFAPYPTTDAHAAYLRSLYAAVVVKGRSRGPFLHSGRPRLESVVSRLRALGLED